MMDIKARIDALSEQEAKAALLNVLSMLSPSVCYRCPLEYVCNNSNDGDCKIEILDAALKIKEARK